MPHDPAGSIHLVGQNLSSLLIVLTFELVGPTEGDVETDLDRVSARGRS